MSHILVVDDNAVDRELVRGILEKRAEIHVEFACDGLEAVEHVEATTPLLVVTDLNMPDMDGLALVKQMRRRYPTIPIVLMTAFGSEETALEALTEGAADYVPKHRLASDLLPTIDSIMLVAAGDRRHDQISQFVSFKKLRYEIPGDMKLIAPLADQIQQATVNLGLVLPADRMRLAKCLVEALRNAILHGSPEQEPMEEHPAPTPCVLVDVELTPTEARYIVRDQGPGFDSSTVVNPRSAPQNLTAAAGRGLNLIQLFMDEVQFNADGNEIVMLKRRNNGSVRCSDR